MAEVIPDQDNLMTTKTGLHSRFTPEQDLAIAREVAAAKAHTPNYGETKKRFGFAADVINQNPLFPDAVTWKTIQDRYKRLQDQYNGMNNENQRLSGVVGGEMGELADLLMNMREARDDWEAEKNAVKVAEKRKEADKERIGRVLVERATKQKQSETEGDEGGEQDNESAAGDGASGDGGSGSSNGSVNGSAQKKRKPPGAIGIGSEMEQFGSHLKESDLARIGLEHEKLEFEKEKDTADRLEREQLRTMQRQEREEERHERREERLEQQKVLEKFKAMLDVLSKKL